MAFPQSQLGPAGLGYPGEAGRVKRPARISAGRKIGDILAVRRSFGRAMDRAALVVVISRQRGNTGLGGLDEINPVRAVVVIVVLGVDIAVEGGGGHGNVVRQAGGVEGEERPPDRHITTGILAGQRHGRKAAPAVSALSGSGVMGGIPIRAILLPDFPVAGAGEIAHGGVSYDRIARVREPAGRNQLSQEDAVFCELIPDLDGNHLRGAGIVPGVGRTDIALYALVVDDFG